MARANGSILAGVVWMFILSILLFWLPLLGPLIAGFVGGRKAGSVGNGILAVVLPAIIFAVLTFTVGAGFLFPFFGALAAAGVFLGFLLHAGPLLVGAIIGGATA